jgi:hypothetical protein
MLLHESAISRRIQSSARRDAPCRDRRTSRRRRPAPAGLRPEPGVNQRVRYWAWLLPEGR